MLAVAGAICLALTAMFIRVGTDGGRSLDALVVVLAINVSVFVPLAVLLHNPLAVSPAAVAAFVGAGIVGTMVGRALFFLGIKRIGASRAEPIKASMPFHASLIAVLVLGETLTLGNFIGILLIIGGVAVISWEGHGGGEFGSTDTPLIGFLLPLAAAFFFGIDPIFAKIGFEEDASVLVGLAIKSVSAMVVFVFYLWWQTELNTDAFQRTGNLRWYVAAGIANTLFLLFNYSALFVAPVVVVIPIIQMSPVFVTIFSYMFLQDLEHVNRILVIGTIIVVVGAIMVTLFG